RHRVTRRSNKRGPDVRSPPLRLHAGHAAIDIRPAQPSRSNPEMMSPRERNSSSHAVRAGRWMARREEPFAVFVFGMRLNRLRGLPRFAWGLRVLRRVLRDLEAHPERGFLAGRVYRAGRTLI